MDFWRIRCTRPPRPGTIVRPGNTPKAITTLMRVKARWSA
jgi:hypothetical protein